MHGKEVQLHHMDFSFQCVPLLPLDINTHPNKPMEEKKRKKLVCSYFNLFKLNKHKKKVTRNETMS